MTCQQFSFEEDSDGGDCKRHKWHIKLDLARKQAVCDDTATGTIETVQILTPLGIKALISKEAYSKEKDGLNFWKPI
jgi:hypothetical protein